VTDPNWHSFDHDVAVIGGGPAGSAAAGALARKGRRVLVVEREVFPRFHIGESLLPLSRSAFRELGIAERVANAGFVEKHGATFAPDDDSERFRIDFASSPEVPDPVTNHVPRAEFDALLLDHAAACGAEVLQGARAHEATFEPDGVRLSFDDASGERRSVRVRYLLDASGRYGFLARRLGLRVPDPELRKVALFAHFSGTPADGVTPGDIRIITSEDLGWWWLIPLEDRMSVGRVFDAENDPRRRGESPEETLTRCIAASAFVAKALAGAERLGPARCEGDYSYSTRAYGGDRFLLLGDAGSFLDPVFSTGVELAIYSALEAVESVERALANNQGLGGRELGRFARRQRRRYRFFRRFVTAFYTRSFREMLYSANDWPRTTRAIVTALAGNDRPRLRTRLLLSWVFFGVALRERQARRSPRRADTALPAPVQTGIH
jgi:FADH2-dependent halogenase